MAGPLGRAGYYQHTAADIFAFHGLGPERIHTVDPFLGDTQPVAVFTGSQIVRYALGFIKLSSAHPDALVDGTSLCGSMEEEVKNSPVLDAGYGDVCVL